MSIRLKRWAIDIECPYLLNNLPYTLTPDITDPCNAWKDYDEPEIHGFWCINGTQNPCKQLETGWQQTKLQPHKEATQTPLPRSQECQNQTPRASITMHTAIVATKEGLTSSTNNNGNEAKTKYENNQVNVSDSTLRITVRWGPNKYNKLACWQHTMERSHWDGAFHPRDSNQSSELSLEISTSSSTSYPIHQADTRPSPCLHWTTNTSHKPCQNIHL